VLEEKDNLVSKITLNKPTAYNSIDRDLINAMKTAVDVIITVQTKKNVF
jgi:enoyl-CoA hydratase/carnithine racemase